MENILALFFACFFALAVAVPLFLWAGWWESYLAIWTTGWERQKYFTKLPSGID